MKIFYLPLEKIETRYTGQWYDYIPKRLTEYCQQNNLAAEIVTVPGDFDKLTGTVTKGAFLNFNETNIWKSSQLINLLSHTISDGDIVFISDAWNPISIQLKYIFSLQNIKAKIVGLWHAGNYDQHDFLGRMIGPARWVRNAERSMFESYDLNFFATEFHRTMFLNSYGLMLTDKRFVTAGFPFDYMCDILTPFASTEKKNQIIFPHRIAPEKQLEIFNDLAASLPQYDWVVCQDKKLTKHEYHKALAESKIVFSANLQETLGISTCIEGPLVNCLPFAPNRLSYAEIFSEYQEFLYPEEWTESFESYQKHKSQLMNRIVLIMSYYEKFVPELADFTKNKLPRFINCDKMFSHIFK